MYFDHIFPLSQLLPDLLHSPTHPTLHFLLKKTKQTTNK